MLFKTQDRWFNGIQQNFVTPLITNLKLDPFERFHDSRGFDEWQENHAWLYGPVGVQLGAFLKSLRAFPPRQKRLDFDIDFMMDVLNANAGR